MALKLHIMPLNPFLFSDEFYPYINLKSIAGLSSAFYKH